MKSYPVPPNESERLKALQDYHILDTLNELEFDRITQLASLICDVPISLISLIDEKRQWFKSGVGLEISETARDLSFCKYSIMGTSMFEVEDATRDERFMDNILVTSDPYIRSYAGFPLIDKDGFALGTLCVIDKEPRKLTEKQVKALRLLADETIDLIQQRIYNQELRHFEKLFHLSKDLICIASRDGYFKKVNPSFVQILGWEEPYLYSTPIFDLIHPDDLAVTKEILKNLKSGQSIVDFVQRLRNSSGVYKVFQWTATPDPLSGNLFIIARDVTQQKLNEHQLKVSETSLKSFFENSQGLMCTHDLDGNFITVNTAGAQLLGYSVEEILTMSLFDLVPPKHYANLQTYLSDIRRTGKVQGLMTTQHRDGSYRIWTFSNILETDLEGKEFVIGNSIDITQRQLLEKDLQKTKEMLERTNNVARVGGWEVDLGKQELYWSDVTRMIHDVSSDFVPDVRSAINFYKEGEHRAKILEAIDKVLLDGTPFDLELQIVTCKNRELWIRSIGNAQFEHGKCKRIFGTFQDIEEKKQVELAVANSRKLLNDVLDSASEVSIIATDPDGIITVFNAGSEKLLGYKAVELIGIHGFEFLHLPEEIEERAVELSTEFSQPISAFRVFVQKAELEGLEQREWTYVRKDGTLCTVSLTVTAMYGLHQEIVGYLGIATDITEQARAEKELMAERARLSAFVKHAPASVAMFDTDIRYIAASNRWIEEYKLEGVELAGRLHYDLFPETSQEWRDIYARSLHGAIEKRDEDVWQPPGWDTDQYLRWEIRPWNYADGSIGGIIMFTQDITEMCQQREELKRAKQQAEMASSAKSEFLANMSHEIRTPLNGVIGFTDLVLKTELNAVQQQYLTIVNQSGSALLSIINDILDFSKIEAGKLELDVERCDLFEIAGQSADIITYQAQKKGIEMLLNIDPALPRFIWVDSIRLKQVLINLLSNAVKFTEKGEIELRIESSEYEMKDGQMKFHFQVRDTGIGIKTEKQEKIFDAFSQEDGSTTKKYGGTGLGLTISNKLLELMGSKLELTSSPANGSTFSFDLTLHTEQGPPILWDDINWIKNVLVVDDNTNNRMIMSQMLLLKGIHSDEAKNGFETLQLLGYGHKYDVILMDYNMPFIDGLETIRKIRANAQFLSQVQHIVLLYSSSDDDTVIKACEELKVRQRLAKPIKMQDMYNALSRLNEKVTINDVVPGREEGIQLDRSVTVLIAEDNDVNMYLAKLLVSRIISNVKIVEARNGFECLAYCQDHVVDFILMDVQMPEMNGYEATQKIRALEAYKNIPIIALTAGNVKGEREKCMEAGMSDFISKPVVEQTMAHVLNKYLRIKEQENIPGSDQTEIRTAMHFNLEKMEASLYGDQEIVIEVLGITMGELEKVLKNIKIHSDVLDWPALKELGHKLYGTASVAGLDHLGFLSKSLEHMISIEPAPWAELIRSIESEIKVVMNLIEERLIQFQ